MAQFNGIENQNFTWMIYDVRAKFSAHWTARAELDLRTYFPSFRLQQTLIPRLHAVRSFGKRHSAGAGLSLFMQFTPQRDETEINGTKKELRIHQDLMPEWELGKTRMSQRIRLEERIFLPEDSASETLFRFRARYLLQESFFWEKSRHWGARAGVEVLVHFGEGVNGRHLDQFRTFGALFWRMNDHWTWDIGYINWLLPQGSGNPLQSRGYIRVAAIHQFTLIRKAG